MKVAAKSALSQIGAVLGIGVSALPRRLGPCLVIVIAIAGVVAVFISVLAMAVSFADTAAKTGRRDRVIVMSQGATVEGGSFLTRDVAETVLSAASIKRSPDGKPVASAEYLTFTRLADKRTGLDAFATVRGTGIQGFSVRPEVRLVSGRLFRAGVPELIVGKTLQRRLDGLDVGSRVPLPEGDWVVVGVFESNADAHESELITDVETLMSAHRQNRFNSITALLEDPAAYETLRRTLLSDPALTVDVRRERDYLVEASRPTTRFLSLIATLIGGTMALGAVFAAINAMYSAVNARATEIATLRAIGYDSGPVVIAVFIEALIYALVGASLGAAIAWVFFNGNSVSTPTSMSPGQIGYILHVSPQVVLLGIGSGCVTGLLGGLFPSIRLSKVSIADALRGA